MSIATQVKERPILFSGPMVRAILDGRKTQTRRIVKLPRWAKGRDIEIDEYGMPCVFDPSQETNAWIRCPYASIDPFGGAEPRYKTGERLWVREGAIQIGHEIPGANGQYRWPKYDAEFGREWFAGTCHYTVDLARNSPAWGEPHGTLNKLFMPRWASRITLEITDVRVERLNSISEEDAQAEGCAPVFYPAYISAGEIVGPDETPATEVFRDLWERINGKGSWDANPFVWVLSFKQLEPAQ